MQRSSRLPSCIKESLLLREGDGKGVKRMGEDGNGRVEEGGEGKVGVESPPFVDPRYAPVYSTAFTGTAPTHDGWPG